jgi:tRNA-binding EMAP/Myf-like protein
LLSVMPFSGYNDGLPSHLGDHSFPATLHSITGGAMDPSVAFTMYVIPGWESNRPWARATITNAQVGETVSQVAWAVGTSFGLYNGFGSNPLSQPDELRGIQQRTVSCACRVRATSSAVNTSGMVFCCSGYFDYSGAWSPAELANYVDMLKQSNHLRPRSMVSTTSRPMVASAAPKSSAESRSYRGVIGIPTSMHRTTEGDKDEAETNVVQVERGHEDIIVIMSDASSTVTWNFEVERKVEIIGSEGILLHAKTRRPIHSPDVVAAADALKQQHAMQAGQ